MRTTFALVALAVSMACLLAGCPRSPANPPRPAAEREEAESGNRRSFVWAEEDIEFGGAKIALGFRDRDQPERVEPMVSITRDGKPVANAMVFAQLVSSDGQQTYSDELAAIYIPETISATGAPVYEAVVHREGERLPEKAVVRFRIVLPGEANDFTHDVPVK
jgi:hypothetical protein